MAANKNSRPATRLSAEDRKAEILHVARKVLAEVQFENFLPSVVADRCGLSEGSIYRYFPSKQDLLVSIAEQRMLEVIKADPELDKVGDIFTRLRNVIFHSLEVVHQEPAITRFIFVNVRIDSNYPNTKLYALNGDFTRRTTDVVRDAIDTGIFRNDIAIPVVRDIIFGAIEHQMWPYLRKDHDAPPLEKVADDIANTVYRGLAVSPPVNTEVIADALARARADMQKIEAEMAFIQDTVGIQDDSI